MKPTLDVSAAVIYGKGERDGLILICQRKRGARHELQWEFPGGKAEPGESPREALARELREELAIEATIGPQLECHEFQYPGADRLTRLWFFRVTEFEGEPVNLEFEQIVWEQPSRLPDYDFLKGDVEFVERLASGAY
jgi:8-oxo-dGTP diphosphatase